MLHPPLPSLQRPPDAAAANPMHDDGRGSISTLRRGADPDPDDDTDRALHSSTWLHGGTDATIVSPSSSSGGCRGATPSSSPP